MSKYCRYCGEPVEASAKFCGKCGESIAVIADPPRYGKLFRISALALSVVLLVALFGKCANNNTDADQEAIREEGRTQQETTVKATQIDPSLIGKIFASGNYEYCVQENGTVYISGYTGNDTELTLPIELDGYVVSGVADNAFNNAPSVSSLVVPGTIYEIGEKAFSGCTNLKRVVIEDGVKVIGYRAFQNGVNNSSTILEAIIPDSIIKMGDRPFGLTNEVSREENGLLYIGKFVVDTSDNFDGHVVFSENTLGIADEAFFYWSGWASEITDTTINIPDGVRYIGEAAFAGQINIDYFRVPASVEEIGACAMLYDYVNNRFELWNSHDKQKIYGCAGTVAEMYAAKNGLNFVISND